MQLAFCERISFVISFIFLRFLNEYYPCLEPDAGSNQTIQLPIASAVLNGNVKDDGEIIRYQWTQIRLVIFFYAQEKNPHIV